MRRVLAYFEWQAAWWEGQSSRRTVDDTRLAAGLKAYAAKQMALRGQLAASFSWKWEKLLLNHNLAILRDDTYSEARTK